MEPNMVLRRNGRFLFGHRYHSVCGMFAHNQKSMAGCDHPKNLSWTCSPVLRPLCQARRDDDAGCHPAKEEQRSMARRA
ncbi:MAG: hypothetical protein FWC38_02700 [Proteobacteria bacterium]|nr:hypothetical protein [Pseudomonadota bacterium]